MSKPFFMLYIYNPLLFDVHLLVEPAIPRTAKLYFNFYVDYD